MEQRRKNRPSVLEGIAAFFLNASWYGLLTYITFALVLMVAIAPGLYYVCKWNPNTPHAILLACAVLVGLAFTLLIRLRGNPLSRLPQSDAGFARCVILLSSILLVLQIALTHAIGFITGWDVWMLTRHVWNIQDRIWYFSMYPNQLYIEGVFRRMIAFASLLGIKDGYAVLVFGSCVCVAFATMLSAFCARRLGGTNVGYATFFVTALLWGLSPWVVIPYTDTYGIPWPILVLFFYLCVDLLPVKIGGIFFFSILGYAVKPTVIFVFLSILVVESCRFITGRRELTVSLRKVLPCALSTILAVSVAYGIVARISDWGMPVDPNKAYSATHYLMMGVNDGNGVWSGEDVEFSNSFDTVEERKAGNITEWRRRVIERGPKGMLKLFLQKTLCNYADGSFSWGVEGHFFSGTYGVCKPLQTFFGVHDPDTDEIPYPFKEPYHVVWLFILLGVICNWKRKPIDAKLVTIALSLLMQSAFLLVFECRARYLYLYGPFFSILSIMGWQCFSRWFMTLEAPTRKQK